MKITSSIKSTGLFDILVRDNRIVKSLFTGTQEDSDSTDNKSCRAFVAFIGSENCDCNCWLTDGVLPENEAHYRKFKKKEIHTTK